MSFVTLTKPKKNGSSGVLKLFWQRRSIRSYKARSLSKIQLSTLLFAAQGINRRGGWRTVPSAGGLYPVELYVAIGDVKQIPHGVYRYQAATHRLQLVSEGQWQHALADAAWQQDWIAKAPVILIYTAAVKRTSRKYGARAWQYIFIEVGHAAQNVVIAAQALGLGSAVAGAFDAARVRRLCRLKKGEKAVYFQTVGTI